MEPRAQRMELRPIKDHSQVLKPNQGTLVGFYLTGFQNVFGPMTSFYLSFYSLWKRNVYNFYSMLILSL